MYCPPATWDHFVEVEAEDGRRVTVSMRDGHDCMYEETVRMQLECALALVQEPENCPGLKTGGILTSASAIGTPLLARFAKAGLPPVVIEGGVMAFVANATGQQSQLRKTLQVASGGEGGQRVFLQHRGVFYDHKGCRQCGFWFFLAWIEGIGVAATVVSAIHCPALGTGDDSSMAGTDEGWGERYQARPHGENGMCGAAAICAGFSLLSLLLLLWPVCAQLGAMGRAIK